MRQSERSHVLSIELTHMRYASAAVPFHCDFELNAARASLLCRDVPHTLRNASAVFIVPGLYNGEQKEGTLQPVSRVYGR